MKTDGRMTGKKVIVTGSGTGIGKGVALEFAREGADVALHYAHSADGAMQAADDIRTMGRRAEAFKADFADVEQVKKLAAQATDLLGGLDVLINNAGITMNLPFEEVTQAQFDTLYHVNVRAQFFLTQALLPLFVDAGKGVILNISSVHALQGLPEHAVYAGTKGAIVAYTRQLAVELAPRGIRVNAIVCGAVTVENHYKVIEDYDPEAFGQVIPAGFMGTPADVGRFAVFLASDDARYILGQSLVIDGGTTSWLSFSDEFRQRYDMRMGKGYVPGM